MPHHHHVRGRGPRPATLRSSTGLHEYAPEICDGLAELAEPLWAAADRLSVAGHALFAAHLGAGRDRTIRCCRRGSPSTASASGAATRTGRSRSPRDIGAVEAGILDGAWRDYDDDWLPRSRGADDDSLEPRTSRWPGAGSSPTARSTNVVSHIDSSSRTASTISLSTAWQALGVELTLRFIDLVESGRRSLRRTDRSDRRPELDARRAEPAGDMTTVERTALIEAAPQAIWKVLADFASISAWAPNVDHSCLLTEQERGSRHDTSHPGRPNHTDRDGAFVGDGLVALVHDLRSAPGHRVGRQHLATRTARRRHTRRR